MLDLPEEAAEAHERRPDRSTPRLNGVSSFGDASIATAGPIGLVLWVDARCALDAAGLRTLCAVVLATVAAGAVALRLTALDFRLGSAAAALLGLGGWTIVVLVRRVRDRRSCRCLWRRVTTKPVDREA
jgi:hypothetical protein